MIPIEKLLAVKTIVVHADCADGLASAMILKFALQCNNIKFVKHNSQEHENLEPVEGLLFCDFSPHKSRTQDFVDVGAIVLDHHARETVEPFGNLSVFADAKTEPGVSGAVLAYRHVFLPLLDGMRGRLTADLFTREKKILLDFAETCGVYDTWQTSSPLWKKSREYTEALHFVPRDTWMVTHPLSLKDKLDFGKFLVAKKDATVASMFKEALRTRVDAYKVLIVQVHDATSINDITELAGNDVDIVAGFKFYCEDNSDRCDWTNDFPKNAKMKVSLRSHKGYDVRELAKRYGGGGHAAAASFVQDITWRHENPYERIITLISDHAKGVTREWVNV